MTFDVDLLALAGTLLRRKVGKRGPLSRAHVRRSVSTTYYALFHFIGFEVTRTIVGTRNDLRQRRRILARTLSHNGVRTTLDKVRGAQIHPSVTGYFSTVPGSTPSAAPAFAREMANTFADAQAKRHDADYDLNKVLSEADARVMWARARRAIRNWKAATSPKDRDFKRAVSALILLKGQLRSE